MSKKTCKFDYLKPISYDDLFDDRSKNKCTDYQLVLDKLTEARSAFFGFQAGIYNFIKDFISDSCLTNERAIQSTFCLAENITSLISLSVKAG